VRPSGLVAWLEVVRPRLAEPLFSHEAVARLFALASRLPGECQAVLEARLAPGPAPVDLSLRLASPAEARRLLDSPLPNPVRAFLAAWAEGDPSLSPVHSVWLETDLDREPPASGLPLPVVCAKLLPRARPPWIVETLLPALGGRPLPAPQAARVRACLDALPPSVYLLYAFALLSRGEGDAVRLELYGFEPAEIPGWLRGLAPEAAEAAAGIAPLFEGVDRIHLSFDVSASGEVLPRVGIEGSFVKLPANEPRWAALFDRLVERGLCDPGKRDAALGWPGSDSFWTAPEAWPAGEGGDPGFCIRLLSHLKVAGRPGEEPEAKVYLKLGPQRRPVCRFR
jgi:hypothetical protein